MGTIEGKIRDSYSVKQRPALKKSSHTGDRPVLNGHIQSNLWPLNQPPIKKHESSKTLPQNKESVLKRKESNEAQAISDTEIEYGRQYPYCSVGLVTYEMGGQQRYGTGFLIGKNIVMTCAHNLFSLDYNQAVKNVCFSPGYGGTKGKQLYKAQQVFFPKQFEKASMQGRKMLEENLCRNDYGIIKLKDNINLSHNYGCLGFNFNSQQHSFSSNKIILGFTHSQTKPISLNRLQGKVQLEDQIISYPFATEIGMSGGPIIDNIGGDFVVIGIHTFYKGRGKEGNGQGVRLTQKIYDQISSWLTTYEQTIDLRDKNLGKQGVKQLVKQKNTLHVINLSRNNLQKDGLKHFSRVQWPNLYQLDIGGNSIGVQGVEYLVKAPMQNLQILNLWGNLIGKEGVAKLINGKWHKLQNINLYNNQICNQGLNILLTRDWELLNSINLGKNNLDNESVELLKKSKWKKIVCLNLWGNNIKQQKKVTEHLHQHFKKMKFLYL